MLWNLEAHGARNRDHPHCLLLSSLSSLDTSASGISASRISSASGAKGWRASDADGTMLSLKPLGAPFGHTFGSLPTLRVLTRFLFTFLVLTEQPIACQRRVRRAKETPCGKARRKGTEMDPPKQRERRGKALDHTESLNNPST